MDVDSSSGNSSLSPEQKQKTFHEKQIRRLREKLELLQLENSQLRVQCARQREIIRAQKWRLANLEVTGRNDERI